MATDRQIQANRRNAERSTGPKTEAGKARSRLNATRHGLAGKLVESEIEAGSLDEFADRRARWAGNQPLNDEAAEWALDKAVAASLRIDRCERAMDDLTDTCRERARLVWEQDRSLEAAEVFGRLARNPVLASRQLRTTMAGVALLIEAWLGLASTLVSGQEWSESEASKALDLLGVDPGLRANGTLIDGPNEANRSAFRRELVFEEIERLEGLRDEALEPLDEMDRQQAMVGDIAILSKPARLLLRYEREAWKRFHQSMKDVKAAAPPTPPPVVVPPPPRTASPTPLVPQPFRGVATVRRELLAHLASDRIEATNRPDDKGRNGEPTRFETPARNEANLASAGPLRTS